MTIFLISYLIMSFIVIAGVIIWAIWVLRDYNEYQKSDYYDPLMQ